MKSHNRDIGHRVQQLGSVHGPTDGLLPLHHDEEMNLIDLHNKGIDHLKSNSNWGISVVC